MKNILLYAHGIVVFLFLGLMLSTPVLHATYGPIAYVWVGVPLMKISAILFSTALLNTIVKRKDPPAQGMAGFVASGTFWMVYAAIIFMISLGQWRYPSMEMREAIAEQEKP